MASQGYLDPPTEFSLAPFWFWNDALDEDELVRQMDDFRAHGVYGFVIHPRVGLPRNIGWMSDRMMHFIRFAVEEAKRRKMFVILYDEGMYPSGSSSGQVVEANSLYQCRCLDHVVLDGDAGPSLQPGQNLITVVPRANGQRIAVFDRSLDAHIRGLHYIGGGPAEDAPLAADILNPDAVATFIHLVYDRYAEALGEHFGTTVRAIFTDEPALLGRTRERGVVPGTTGIIDFANATLGYNFTPHLPALWYDEEPNAPHYRAEYERVLTRRLATTYYEQLYDWCEEHRIALAGHPGHGDDIGFLRYFHIPGQDIVWRWVLPGPTALEGRESTQGKCSASAALHLGRRRNSNEAFGAYGHGFTWNEMKWLVDWCFVRGVNRLYPHAFYYSIRGPRKDERPPDVGPNSPWWDTYKSFADYCRRLSWLNTDSTQVCHVAILTEATHLPWSAAKVCFQHQRDFNYLELRYLWEDAAQTRSVAQTRSAAQTQEAAAQTRDAIVSQGGIRIAGMHYEVAIIDGLEAIPPEAVPALETLARAGRLITWGESQPAGIPAQAVNVQTPDALITLIDAFVSPDLVVCPDVEDLRYRHVFKEGIDYYLLWNEGLTPLQTTITVTREGPVAWLDPLAVTESAAKPIAEHIFCGPEAEGCHGCASLSDYESAAGGAGFATFELALAPYTLRILRIGDPIE